MALICTISHHHRRDGMDKLLLRGEQLKDVARRYSVSEDATEEPNRVLSGVKIYRLLKIADQPVCVTQIGSLAAGLYRLLKHPSSRAGRQTVPIS